LTSPDCPGKAAYKEGGAEFKKETTEELNGAPLTVGDRENKPINKVKGVKMEKIKQKVNFLIRL